MVTANGGAPSPDDLVRSLGTDVGIVTFVPDRWEGYWASRHYLMKALSAHLRVLWVSPPWHWRAALRAAPEGLRTSGFRQVAQKLWAYAPGRAVPGTHGRHFLERWLTRQRASRIATLARRVGILRPVLYVWRPAFMAYAPYFPEAPVCYHIDDEYSFSERDSAVSEQERQALQQADAVLIHSRSLLRKKGAFHPNTHYVPNGVDFGGYRAAVNETGRRMEDIESLPRPIIGYSGHIRKHIDLKLLLHVARARPQWSVVLVGPVNPKHPDIREDITRLKREANVHFLGGKTPEELPYYVRHFDVSLMCYRHTDYTKYIFPMKLYEYLSVGAPVVSTPLENLLEFSDVLRFADHDDAWVEEIEQALRESTAGAPGAAAVERRIATARDNSWDARAATVLRVIHGLHASPRRTSSS